MTTLRQLTINNLAIGLRLPKEEAAGLASPLLDVLRNLTPPSHQDPASIPYRGTEVFREMLEGRSIAALRAAHVAIRRLGCQSGVIDAIELARGTAEE